MYFASGSCFILTCYETVHCTVSAKFINEFGASCLLCFAQFTPPSKRRKAPKIAWTRCPSYFSIPPSATSCTHLPLQGRQKGLFNFDRARFSHFIDSLEAANGRLFYFIQIQNVSKAYSLLYRLRYSKGYSFSKYEPKRLSPLR